MLRLNKNVLIILLFDIFLLLLIFIHPGFLTPKADATWGHYKWPVFNSHTNTVDTTNSNNTSKMNNH